MKLKIVALVTTLILAFSAQANDDDMAPSCLQPNKPGQFYSQAELDKYNTDVQQYQRCLYDFVTAQEEAIQRHQRAANNAIDEWNSFVRQELN